MGSLRKLFFISIGVILTLINVYLLFKLKQAQQINAKAIKLSASYRQSLIYNIGHAGIFSSDAVRKLSDIAQSLPNPFTLNNKLFFRITERHCLPCIEKEIQNLKKFSNNIRDNEIVIVASYAGYNDLQILRQKYKLTYIMLNIPNGLLENYAVEKENTPYYFTIDDSGNCSALFIPDKSSPEVTMDYLNNTDI